MAYYKKLVGEKCYLSPIAVEDAVKWTQWLNDLEVTVPLGDEAYIPYSEPKTQEDIRWLIEHKEHIFTIVDLATNCPVGRCLYFSLDHVNRSAMIGIFIGEKDFWGQGYGQEAIRLLLDYGFNLLNLHSVMLGVFSFNQRAYHAYRKLGFREIGRRREARIIAGVKHDAILMDILEDEFRALHGSTRLSGLPMA